MWFQLNKRGSGPIAQCHADATAGSLVVPSAVFTALGSGPLDVQPSVQSITSANVDGWRVTATFVEALDVSSVLTVP